MKVLKLMLLTAVLAGILSAQTMSLSAPSTVVAGKTVTVTATLTAGSSDLAALQWNLAGGTSGAWAIGAAGTAANKTLDCENAASTQCILAAMNTTVIGSGIVATVPATFASSVRGPQQITLSGVVGSSPTGSAVTVATNSPISILVVSPYDLNGDGVVDGKDFDLAKSQVHGDSACGSADFNGDGVCNVLDLVLLAVDSSLPNP